MAIRTATPATFAAMLAACVSGDVLALAPGDYGDVDIRRRAFTDPVRIISAEPVKPARLRSLTVKETVGILFEGLVVAFTPTAATVADTPVVTIDGCQRIAILGGEIFSGPAVNGVKPEAAALDATQNVLGLPTCKGVVIISSSDVSVQGANIHHLARGVNVGLSARVTIYGNEIHHLRRSGIVGGADDLTIEANRLHSNSPWRYGETAAGGDHGDFIAIWNGSKTVPMRNVAIRANDMATGDGKPMMSMWVQGGAGRAENVQITANKIRGGDHQGIVVSDVTGGLISRNDLLQDSPTGKPVGIIVGDGCANVSATDNIAASVSDKSAGKTGNLLARNAAPGAAPVVVPPPVVKPPETTPEPPKDALRVALALRTEAKVDPTLKVKGRVILDFKTKAEAQAALAAIQSA